MNQMKGAEEVEDALRDLAPLPVSRRPDSPARQPVGDCLRTPEPLYETPRPRQLLAAFGQLWRDRPPVMLNMSVVGEEHAL